MIINPGVSRILERHLGRRGEFRNTLTEFIPNVKMLDEQNAMYLFQEVYDTTTGLFDHNTADAHPFGGVLLRENANPFMDGPLRDLMSEYVDEDYKTKFGLSLMEFLDLPMPYLEMIRRIAAEPSAKATREAKELEEFNKAMKSMNTKSPKT